MKIVILAILFSFITSYTFSQSTKDTNCAILKSGKFKYLNIEDTTAYFVIKGSDHVEYHKNGKFFIKSDLVWKTPCQYAMKMKECTIPDFPFKPGDIMVVTINKIEGKIIHYTSSVKGNKWQGSLQKLE